MDFFFFFKISNLCFCLLVLTLSLKKQDPSYRILMPVRQCTRWFVQHMLPHWLFITAAHYEKRLHPSPTSNEFLHAELNSGSRRLVRAVSEKDKDWTAIIAYYVTALQAWREMRPMPGGGWEEKAGFWAWGLAAFGAVRDFSLKLPPQPCGAHGGSMIKLFHMVAQTNVLLLKCRQRSWCELCMYTNELCCCMLLWWLPSLLGIDPSGVKTGRKEGRRRATSSSNRTARHSTVASHQVQGLFRHVLGKKPYGPEFELHQRVFLFYS